MKFARIVFLVAGIYGLLVVAPQYFLEARIGRDTPPAITHPEFFYGFVGVESFSSVFIPDLFHMPGAQSDACVGAE